MHRQPRTILTMLLGLLAFGILGFIVFSTVAQAAEPLDITICRSGTLTFLHKSTELTIYTLRHNGIARSNHANKAWDNFTQTCVGVINVAAGKTTGNGYCKEQSPEGDIALVDWTSSTDKPGSGTWKFLHGTGKLQGIRGSGNYSYITPSKPIEEGTYQNCVGLTGTFEVAK